MAKKKSFRKLLAAAFALTLVGGMGAAATANAATGAPWDAANATKTGTINIYKLKDGANVNADHSKIDPTTLNSADAVPGAEFTVTPVTQVKVGNDKKDVNLKTFEGWKDISKVISGLNANPEDTTLYTLGTAVGPQTTDTDGKAVFSNLNIGLYKVVETKVPAGYTGTTTFFMTIPQVTGSDSANATYKYDVNVFPKNTDVSKTLGKTLDDGSFVGAGDTANYTITAATTTVANKGASGYVAKDFTDYAIFDDAPNAAYSNITAAAVKEVKVGDTALEAADYEVSVITAESSADKFSKGLAAGHTRIIVKFKDTGLNKIASAKNDDDNVKVSMKVSLTLKDTDLPDTVTNKAGYVPGYNPDTPGVPTPDPVTPPTPTPDNPTPGIVETKFGDFKIKKVAAENNNTTLTGAEFLAFATENDANACAADTTRAAANCADKASKIELKSGADGLTTAKKVKLGKEFYVVETKAPAKYVLSSEVTKVTATADSATTPIVIENVLSSDSGTWFNLPRTGAIGVGIFALLGAGLVAGGTAMHMRSRRREDA